MKNPAVPAPKPPPAIEVRGVTKTFRPMHGATVVTALQDISFTCERNSFVTLVGPSGCGKTTLLRMLNGLIPADSGEILVDGHPPHPGIEMGFVFQSFRLLPWRTVLQNVGYTLEVNGVEPAEVKERAGRYLDLVGLSRFANAYPSELSGGMRQRVALARALVGEPRYLLMDEPFANLDAQMREFMQIEMLRILQDRDVNVVFVTHSPDEAVLMSDRIVILRPRPGRVSEVVDVDLPHPRWEGDLRMEPRFAELRGHLWDRIKAMVLEDPESEFYGREIGSIGRTASKD